MKDGHNETVKIYFQRRKKKERAHTRTRTHTHTHTHTTRMAFFQRTLLRTNFFLGIVQDTLLYIYIYSAHGIDTYIPNDPGSFGKKKEPPTSGNRPIPVSGMAYCAS